MRIGSLFSGIGGLELGLEWAGVGHTVFQVEQDPYCLAVLAKHWPEAQRFTDVREVGAHNLPAVEVICGGFPCQDVSVAGKGAGLAGDRSGLWSHYRRLLEEIAPEYVVIENVAALRSRGLDKVLSDLDALLYVGEGHCIPASYVGANHRRDRIWIVARRAPYVDDAERSRLEGHARNGDDAEGRPQQVRPITPSDIRCGEDTARWWESEPDVGRVANGIPARVDRLRALGNAVVPQVAEVVGRRLMQIHAASSDRDYSCTVAQP